MQNVCTGYGQKQVLYDVSAKIRKGKITVIIGPNGCGKSTLLKSAAGILPLYSGKVYINGESLSEKTQQEIAQNISYLEQGKNTPDMTVGQMVLHGRFPYLSYPRRYSKADKEIAKKAMDNMQIFRYATASLQSLSGGIRQSAFIAMALCQETEFVFLDEPTTYLDIQNTLQLLEIIEKLRTEGKGIAIILHDILLAMEYADSIIVMYDGKTVMQAPPDLVYTSGIIQKIFGVNLQRTETENGFSYSFVKSNTYLR